MNVQIVYDKMPAFGPRVFGGDDPLEMGQEIRLGPPLSTRGRDDSPAHHVPTNDERGAPVADVLEFAPLELARFVRQIGMLAFKGLHAPVNSSVLTTLSPLAANFSGASW